MYLFSWASKYWYGSSENKTDNTPLPSIEQIEEAEEWIEEKVKQELLNDDVISDTEVIMDDDPELEQIENYEEQLDNKIEKDLQQHQEELLQITNDDIEDLPDLIDVNDLPDVDVVIDVQQVINEPQVKFDLTSNDFMNFLQHLSNNDIYVSDNISDSYLKTECGKINQNKLVDYSDSEDSESDDNSEETIVNKNDVEELTDEEYSLLHKQRINQILKIVDDIDDNDLIEFDDIIEDISDIEDDPIVEDDIQYIEDFIVEQKVEETDSDDSTTDENNEDTKSSDEEVVEPQQFNQKRYYNHRGFRYNRNFRTRYGYGRRGGYRKVYNKKSSYRQNKYY